MNLEWLIIRGSGIIAFCLLSGATIWGLLVSTKVLRRIVKAKPLAWFHESLAIGALISTGVHVAVLSVHDYLDFTWAEILVPGESDWRPLPVAFGVVALYGLVVVAGSFYVKKRIGQRAWRAVHFTSFGVFVSSLVHGITAGTDTRTPMMLGLYFGSALVVTILLGLRLTAPESADVRRGRSSPVVPRSTDPRVSAMSES